MRTADVLTRIAADLDTLGDESIYNVTVADIVRDWNGSRDTGVGDTTTRHLAVALRQRAKELNHGTAPLKPGSRSSIAGEYSSPAGD